MAKNKENKGKTGQRFSAQLSMAEETATLTVTGQIGWDTEAVAFTDKVKAAKEAGATRLVVRINSLGGYCYDGLAMGDCLKTCGMETVAEVYGTAQSMASYLVQCCTVRKAHQHATLMFHQPSAGVFGTVDEIMTQAVHLVKMRDQMFEDMAARCGSTGPELSAEHMSMKIYSAEEALAKGFLDEIERGDSDADDYTPEPAPAPEPAAARGGLLEYGAVLKMAMCAECDGEEPATEEPATEEPADKPLTRKEVAEMISKAQAATAASLGAPVSSLPAAGGASPQMGKQVQYTMEELDAMPAMKRMAVLSTNPQLAAKYHMH